MKARLAFGVVILAVVVGFCATTGLADPNLTNVPAHRHWLGDPADGVQIGPKLCDNPKVQKAFNQFHHNVHHSFIPGTGVIDSLGPQDGAPGLNNDHGGEINATGILLPNGTRCGLPTG